MRKTLLIAAATLAAGVIAAQADSPVYSQNIVGYYNVTVPGNNTFQFIANQLQTSTANGTNNVQDVFAGSSLISDPNGIVNTVLYFWNGNGYTIYSYYSAADSGGLAGWYDGSGNYVTNTFFQQGSGSFLANSAATPVTLTFVGSVVQGTNVLTIKPGFNALSIIEPVVTNIDSVLVGFPGTSDPNGINNDLYYAFNNGWTILSYYSAVDSGGAAGFYDGAGTYQSLNPAYFPKVGSAFFIDHVANTTVQWTNVFTVQ